MGIRLADVAKAAGVSPATVSRVLNNRGNIAEETKSKVISVALEMGYQHKPASHAEDLAVKRIGVLNSRIPDLFGNVFYGSVLDSLNEVVAPHGYQLVSHSLPGDFSKDWQLVRQLIQSKYSGLAFVGQWNKDRETIIAARNGGIPLILIDNDLWSEGVDCVAADNESGISLLVDQLVELGHHRIAYVSGPLSHSSLEQRYSAFQQSLVKHDLDRNPDLFSVIEAYNYAGGSEGVCRILDTVDRLPTAVVAANDELAIGVMRALHDRGYRVPDDISVTGFDNVEISRHYVPSLTTISVARDEMGSIAGRRLLQLIDGDYFKPVKIIVSVEMHLRDSVGEALQSNICKIKR